MLPDCIRITSPRTVSVGKRWSDYAGERQPNHYDILTGSSGHAVRMDGKIHLDVVSLCVMRLLGSSFWKGWLVNGIRVDDTGRFSSSS